MKSPVLPSTPVISDSTEFRRRLRALIVLTWTLPPVMGLSFLLFIRMFTVEQMGIILMRPLEPAFVVGSLLLASWYLLRRVEPVTRYLDGGCQEADAPAALAAMGRFALHYWGAFLVYLVIAPSTVIGSAEIWTDFTATPADWFRIHLVALIISIIVGLPLFFLILDLFGRTARQLPLERPQVTIKTKVFLIGALVPLLIDTMLVQYYWTRTGFFTTETFFVWLVLELLAIGGSLIFVHSFGQSLVPLEAALSVAQGDAGAGSAALLPRSTDELGVISLQFSRLLAEVDAYNDILRQSARIAHLSREGIGIEAAIKGVTDICQEATGSDLATIGLLDAADASLSFTAVSGQAYRPEGFCRIPVTDNSFAAKVYQQSAVLVFARTDDVELDCTLPDSVEHQAGSVIGAPLVVEDRAVGVLIATRADASRAYVERDIRLVEQLSREVAVTLHAHRMREQLRLDRLAREQREAQVQMLLAATEEGILGLDRDGHCTFVNSACLQMLGYDSEDDVLGRKVSEIIRAEAPEHATDDAHLLDQALTYGRSRHFKAKNIHTRNGTALAIEGWFHPLVSNGVPGGGVLTFVDIRERLETERRLEAYRSHLEDLVATRTEEMRKAMVAAEKANTAKSEFLSRMSHELRTPLNGILGFAQLLGLDKSLDQKHRDSAQEIISAGRHLLALINEVLDLSRIEAGQLQLSVTPVNVARTVDDAVSLMRPMIDGQAITLQCDITDPGLVVMAEETRLREIMLNLLSNAVKYAGQGAVVDVSVASERDRCVISVSDNGPGINAEQQSRLFEPFYRGSADLTGLEGAGIGLSISKKLVELMQGKIRVSSQPGQGSTFTVILPMNIDG